VTLILASPPLGLNMLAARESGGEDEDDNMMMETEVLAPDFLSSIEICWVSQQTIS
jgi:hypothetical protein